MHQSLMHQDSETRSAKKVNQTELNEQKKLYKAKENCKLEERISFYISILKMNFNAKMCEKNGTWKHLYILSQCSIPSNNYAQLTKKIK